MTILNQARLEQEIRGARNNLLSRMSTRIAHPTYGITKKNLWNDYYELQGMCFAWCYLSGAWTHTGRIHIDEDVNDTLMTSLSVDLLKYYENIEGMR